MRPILQIVPLILIPALIVLPSSADAPALDGRSQPEPRAAERLVIVIADALDQRNVNPDDMPWLADASQGASVRIATCVANYSFPCILTMLDGRDGAYRSTLNKFWGGSGRSGLFQAAVESGMETGLVSNHMMYSMNGPAVTRWIDTEPLGRDILERDLLSLDRGRDLLNQHPVRLLVIHLHGTDKISHFGWRDEAVYRHHFHEVDRALASFAAGLDPRSDNLVVVGDHGNERGQHTRRSIAVMKGKRFEEISSAIPKTVDQRDMLYFLSYPLGLPLPFTYEGQFFARAADEGQHDDVEQYVAAQRRAFESNGWTSSNLERRFSPQWTPDAPASVRDVVTLLPIAFAFLGWLWLTVPSTANAERTRLLPLLFVAAVGAGVTGYYSLPIATFFYRNLWPGLPILIGSIFAAGALIAWGRTGRVSSLPLGVQLVCFLVLAGGYRVSQMAQNLLRWYLVAAMIVVAAAAARTVLKSRATEVVRRAWPVLLTLAFGFVLVGIPNARRIRWRPELHVRLVQGSDWIPAILAFVCFVWLTVRLQPGRRLPFALICAALGAYGLWAELSVTWLAITLMMVLFLMLWLDRYVTGQTASVVTAEEEGLIVAGFLLITLMEAFGGFPLSRIDFSFGQHLVEGINEEYLWILILTPLTVLKYIAGTVMALTFYCSFRGREAARRVVTWTLFFINTKLLCTLVAIAWGMTHPSDDSYSWTIGDLVLVWVLGLVVASIAIPMTRQAPKAQIAAAAI